MQNANHNASLRLEMLEDRRLLAQTPELLFSVGFDQSPVEVADVLGPVTAIGGDKFVSRRGFLLHGDGKLLVNDAGQLSHINSIPTQAPTFQTAFQDRIFIFFNGDDYSTYGSGVGQELWASDGTTAELVKHISKGRTISEGSFVFGDHLYFLADGDATSSEDGLVSGAPGLWRSDGTEAGTVPASLMPGAQYVEVLEEMNGKLIVRTGTFIPQSSAMRFQLWSFDGTPEGTFPLSSGDTGTTRWPNRNPLEHQQLGDEILYTATTESGRDLYATDGTVDGTRLVYDFPLSSRPQDLAILDGHVYLTAGPLNGPHEIWKSDGTAAGTTVVIENPGQISETMQTNASLFAATSTGLYEISDGSDAHTLTTANDVDLLATTDNRVLFSTADKVMVWGNEMAEPQEIAANLGDVLYATSEQFVFLVTNSSEEMRPEEHPDIPFTVVNQSLWSTDGTSPAIQITEPISYAALKTTFEYSRFKLKSTRILEDQLLFRRITSDLMGDHVNESIFAIDIDSSARLPGEAPPRQAFLDGDTDRNGTVNFADFLALSANFGKVDAVWADGDFDGDGSVAFADFLLLSQNFGMTVG